MNIKTKKLVNNSLALCGLMAIGGFANADCKVNTSIEGSSVSIPAISLLDEGVASEQLNSGFACTGFSLALINISYLRFRVEQVSNTFTNAQTGEQLNASLLTPTDNEVISVGTEKDMSGLSAVNFFTGPDGNLPFYIRLPAGQNVSPGVYTSDVPLQVKWFYSVPGLAVLGIGAFYESRGFNRGFLGVGFSWGTGVTSNSPLSITVLPDCRILTQDVNFGTAPSASHLEPVQSTVGIRCASKTPYYVSLNNGLYPQDGSQRAMKSDLGDVYLKYDIFKNSSNVRWGSGNERWSSNEATSNAGQYDAIAQQNYAFTTKIIDENSDSTPAGGYEDTITVQVEF